ncbi:MAG: ABC transporter ATP-binding protein [Bacteroidales bacterium]|jgi:iron complex transport system ATP-binding protein|nr:ABC transporter ATP-binding protein [Bacteroidales bacterium]MCI2134010.1 ABC transporter ATP-binding protein [Bacteroidales bacterium]
MLKAKNLIVGYKKAICKPLSFSFGDGKCIMLTGPNGSGKSTLLKTLAGLIPPVSGKFSSSGRVIMVPTHIPKVKGFTVKEFILTGMLQSSGMFGRLRPSAEKAADEAIDALGLGSLESQDLSRISDGEFQKACMATALTNEASVLLLDEPTAFLDVDNRIMVLSTLRSLARESGTTVMFSTHDISDGAKYSDAEISLLKH